MISPQGVFSFNMFTIFDRGNMTIIAIQYLRGGYGSIDMGAMMGVLVLAIIPIIIFYLFCQKGLSSAADSHSRSTWSEG